eukprot:11180416-Lingulodinium_polyedra.AAC.1
MSTSEQCMEGPTDAQALHHIRLGAELVDLAHRRGGHTEPLARGCNGLVAAIRHENNDSPDRMKAML